MKLLVFYFSCIVLLILTNIVDAEPKNIHIHLSGKGKQRDQGQEIGSSGKTQTNPNAAALTKYKIGWEIGDINMMYGVLDKTFKHTMTYKTMKKPFKSINRNGFKKFMTTLKNAVAANRGPPKKSSNFARFTNVKKRKDGTGIIETGIVTITGFFNWPL
eukprot:TRINITY_DN6154_c0_g1_i2.p1 TRINITY_DN6154_c0_g1~~TRINITY_DN6154_c0_g1_i2.p1  ORF type:complete len:159 (-),score=12.01 TRINITY_DN6154_c0_g1_i2:168-644(-)